VGGAKGEGEFEGSGRGFKMTSSTRRRAEPRGEGELEGSGRGFKMTSSTRSVKDVALGRTKNQTTKKKKTKQNKRRTQQPKIVTVAPEFFLCSHWSSSFYFRFVLSFFFKQKTIYKKMKRFVEIDLAFLSFSEEKKNIVDFVLHWIPVELSVGL